jgi:hypothetical protein
MKNNWSLILMVDYIRLELGMNIQFTTYLSTKPDIAIN